MAFRLERTFARKRKNLRQTSSRLHLMLQHLALALKWL